MSIAIEFNHVSKQYRLGLVSTRTLSHDLQRWWTMNIRGKEDPYLKIGETNDRSTKGSSDYVWALKDIDLRSQGDVDDIVLGEKCRRIIYFRPYEFGRTKDISYICNRV